MIKYGKKKHLKQLISGMVRFAPTEDYIKLQRETGEKGQGDSDEGKLYIKATRAIMQPHDNTNTTNFVQNANFKISFDELNRKPVFCLSQYFEEDTTDGTTLSIAQDKVDTIKHNFPGATHALIIKEPEKFISDLMKISESVNSNEIQYYDYNHNWINMYIFVAGEDNEKNKVGTVYNITTENIYRQLYCKSDELKKQQEYRFILTDWLISKPIFLPFTFTSKYKIVPIKRLYKKIKLQ